MTSFSRVLSQVILLSSSCVTLLAPVGITQITTTLNLANDATKLSHFLNHDEEI